MSNKLDLSLPDRSQAKKTVSFRVPTLLIGLTLGIVITNLLITLQRNPVVSPTKSDENSLSQEALKQLALKFEKQGLPAIAAQAWKDYLKAATTTPNETAKVWYRIGTLYEESNEYEKALESYYRSESFAKIDELASEIGRRTERCLEALGKFAALRYELAERVGLDKSDAKVGETVVAEIGRRKITKAVLDRMIEVHIERQLSQFASFLPEQEQKRQKEALLQQYSSASQRRQFLDQFILQEILSRKARETKLTEDSNIRDLLEDQERTLLATQMIQKEYADQVKITPSDLETYFKANKTNYMRPERAKIGHILVSDSEIAATVLERARSGESFNYLVAEFSIDENTKDKNGDIDEWIEKDDYIHGIGNSAEAQNLIFSTNAGDVASEIVETDKGFHVIKVREREQASQKPFDEVRTQVYQALRSQKEREVQERLLAELRDQYDVVIHQSALTENTEPSDTNGNE